MTKTISKPKHASASDWDFSGINWSIQTDQYVSPPSSLRWQRPAGTDISDFALCKAPGTLKLPQGRLISYFRPVKTTHFLWMLFRNTSSIGLANTNNGYYIFLENDYSVCHLYEVLAGIGQRSWAIPLTSFAVPAWRRYRLSWWITWDILQVRLEHEVDGEWLQDGDDITISDPLFGDQDIQRCGVGCQYAATPNYGHIDDTEIWEYP